MNLTHHGPGGRVGADCLRRIIFFHSDTLIGIHFGINNRGSEWTEAVRRVKPDIVVIGATSHLPFLSDFKTVLHQVSSEHQRFFPNLTLIWKTSQPGGCALRALDDLPPAQQSYWQTYEGMQYNWGQFEKYDAYARSFLSDPSLVSSHVLDLQPLHLRTDAHPGSSPGPASIPGISERCKIDCLHMCQPGPLDLVPVLLHHMLHHLLHPVQQSDLAASSSRLRSWRQRQGEVVKDEGVPIECEAAQEEMGDDQLLLLE